MTNKPIEETETFPPATWRLILESEPRSGPANMAVDEAIAEACATGESLPTLRFYRWDPATISLGRNQPVADLDMPLIKRAGFDVVRRSTGGRAILHTDELTYSVAAPADEPRARGGVMDAYLRLSNALLAGLNGLDLPADKAPGHVRAGAEVSAACFEVPSAYEITSGGRKLMGSAQSRRAGYVLQHGSLPLVGEITRLVDYLALDSLGAEMLRRQLGERACTLAQALAVADDSPQLRFENVAEALLHGFSTTLNLTFKRATLSPAETRRSAVLIRERFANPAWTEQK
ncbi:MAG: lipoate--protein ligase family protein [Caldilineaceae bacterium]|nr:lipoate--protein ligase family protein [Caldilineaceae bacterium]MBP8106676.1 lipoate--protein ligase family protein [Caldilineaceae bacterium]MBP8122184.1 lipoate--protein ligase family protein [Caldilineaceae bacterium]MBP9071727.1 lipoate--protein ligase family protein [Caldilineaceae bacterium]